MNTFRNTWASPPGETILDALEERMIDIPAFAYEMGFPVESIEKLTSGDIEVTVDIAVRLERTIGSSAKFWLNREREFQRDRRCQVIDCLSHSDSAWLRALPTSDMIRLGWLPSPSPNVTLLEQCLQFFEVPDLAAWGEVYRDKFCNVAFKHTRTFASDFTALVTWLQRAEVESRSVDCSPWNKELFREVLVDIRRLTKQKDPRTFLPTLKERCAAAGVAVLVVRAPSNCRATGATYFLSAEKALIVLSCRYLSDDHFWFAFFHEAAHLVLHEDSSFFMEGSNSADDKLENEADSFASAILIPAEHDSAMNRLPCDAGVIIRFAQRVGVAPGIIVGQLQHRGRLGYQELNSLKRRYSW